MFQVNVASCSVLTVMTLPVNWSIGSFLVNSSSEFMINMPSLGRTLNSSPLALIYASSVTQQSKWRIPIFVIIPIWDLNYLKSFVISPGCPTGVSKTAASVVSSIFIKFSKCPVRPFAEFRVPVTFTYLFKTCCIMPTVVDFPQVPVTAMTGISNCTL